MRKDPNNRDIEILYNRYIQKIKKRWKYFKYALVNTFWGLSLKFFYNF